MGDETGLKLNITFLTFASLFLTKKSNADDAFPICKIKSILSDLISILISVSQSYTPLRSPSPLPQEKMAHGIDAFPFYLAIYQHKNEKRSTLSTALLIGTKRQVLQVM